MTDQSTICQLKKSYYVAQDHGGANPDKADGGDDRLVNYLENERKKYDVAQDRGGAEPDRAEGGDDRPVGPGLATYAP